MNLSPEAKARVLAAVLLAAAAIVLFAPALRSDRVLFGRDITPFFYPMKTYLAAAVRAGRFPLWNPYVASGEPFFASLQPGLLYPASLLLYAAPPVLSFDWVVFVHYPLAGIGTWLLLRRWGASAPAAWLGAVAFALGGFFVSLGNFPNNLQTVAWVPWLFWAWDRVRAGPAPRRVALFSVLCAVAFLGGEPQMLGLALAWIFLHGLLGVERTETGRTSQLAAFATAGIVALLLVGIQLVPFLEYVAHSVRTVDVGIDYASSRALDAGGALHLVLPPVLDAGVYGFTTRFLAAARVPWVLSPYVGVVVAGAAILGLPASGRRRGLFWSVSAVLGVVMAFGANGPVYRALFELVPILRPFRYPEKFLLLTAFSVAVLAARGADSAARGRATAVRVFGALALAAGLVGLVLYGAPGIVARGCASVLAASRLCDDPTGAARLYAAVALRLGLLAALAAATIELARRGRLRAEAAAALLAILAAADLVAANARVNPTVEREIYERPAWPATVLAGAGADRDMFRFRGSPENAAMGSILTVPGAFELSNLYLDFESMGPNVGQLFGVLQQDGLQGVELRSVALGNEAAMHGWAEDPVRFLRAMNVRWYADPTATADGMSGLRVLARHPDLPLRLFEVPDPLPRVYLVGAWEISPGPEAALRRFLSPAFPLGAAIPLEEEPVPSPRGPAGGVAGFEAGHGTLEIRTRSGGPSLLVVHERFYPGWTATVNGEKTRVLRAAGQFLAIPVPGGESLVRLVYRPATLRTGAALSLVGLLFLGGLFALTPGRRREAA